MNFSVALSFILNSVAINADLLNFPTNYKPLIRTMIRMGKHGKLPDAHLILEHEAKSSSTYYYCYCYCYQHHCHLSQNSLDKLVPRCIWPIWGGMPMPIPGLMFKKKDAATLANCLGGVFLAMNIRGFCSIVGPLPNGLFMAYKWGLILTTGTENGFREPKCPRFGNIRHPIHWRSVSGESKDQISISLKSSARKFTCKFTTPIIISH